MLNVSRNQPLGLEAELAVCRAGYRGTGGTGGASATSRTGETSKSIASMALIAYRVCCAYLVDYVCYVVCPRLKRGALSLALR